MLRVMFLLLTGVTILVAQHQLLMTETPPKIATGLSSHKLTGHQKTLGTSNFLKKWILLDQERKTDVWPVICSLPLKPLHSIVPHHESNFNIFIMCCSFLIIQGGNVQFGWRKKKTHTHNFSHSLRVLFSRKHDLQNKNFMKCLPTSLSRGTSSWSLMTSR